jgi:adenylosuccinate synthase
MFNWGRHGEACVLIGGQFGSEGKGQAAAFLAVKAVGKVNIATTNAGAQAGHTTNFRHKLPNVPERFVCFHLPTTAVVHNTSLALINAGSIIDVDQLLQEIAACSAHGRVFIHPSAAVIQPEDTTLEKAAGSSTSRIASTQKGVGAAIANKIMRRSKLAKDIAPLQSMLAHPDIVDLNQQIMDGMSVVVEVPQGTGLSINRGFYPYTTSRDCWLGAGLTDAGIHPKHCGTVAMVMRTFPIRVGNLYNEMGEEIGTSGPFYKDSMELDWDRDFPGIEPERTTVTKRVRRIATWSDKQYHAALMLNRPDIVILTFCDYFGSAPDFRHMIKRMQQVEEKAGLHVKKAFSFGPHVEDMTSFMEEAVTWYDKRSFL